VNINISGLSSVFAVSENGYSNILSTRYSNPRITNNTFRATLVVTDGAIHEFKIGFTGTSTGGWSFLDTPIIRFTRTL